MKILPLILPAVLASALGLGMAFPGRPPEALQVMRGAVADAGPVIRVGESTSEAVRFLRTLRSDPPPPPGPPPPPPPPPPSPPPPPPDVSVVFRSALTGISRDPVTGRYSVLLRDPAAGGPQIVARQVGDAFGNSWRINSISADTVTLAKGSERRTIRLFG